MIYSATFKIYAVNKVAEVIFYLNDNLFVFLIEARINEIHRMLRSRRCTNSNLKLNL